MNDDFKDSILRQWPMNQVELRRKEYAASVAIDERELDLCLRRSELDEVRDIGHGRLLMTLRMQVYGKDHAKKHVIRYPATWRDAVKERFAPAWFLDRYPVRFTVVEALLEELYPDIEPALPDRNPVMKFTVAKRDECLVW